METKRNAESSSSSDDSEDIQQDGGNEDDDDIDDDPGYANSSSPRVGANQSNSKRKKLFVRELQLGVTAEDGFVLSAGLDQDIMLWTMDGDCVGRFGSEVWDINDARTWGERSFEPEPTPNTVVMDSVLSNVVIHPIKLRVKDTGKRSKHKSKSTSRNITDVQTYVQNLVRKIAARPPLSHEQNTKFTQLLTHHPVVDVEKFVQNNPKYIDSGAASRIVKVANARL